MFPLSQYQNAQSMMMMPIQQAQSQYGEALRAKSVEFLRAMSGEDLRMRGANQNRDINSNSQMDSELGGGWTWSDVQNEVSLLMSPAQSSSGNPTVTPISSGYEVKSTGAQLRMKVLLDKPFKNNKRLGFNWHKSWNIPKITVKMEGRHLIEKLSEKMHLYAFAVKRSHGSMAAASPALMGGSEIFQSIGLKGQTACELSDEETTLSGLSFSSTSYIHTGAKFVLLLIVSVGKLLPGSKNNKILFCKISPEIYVDSRKSAREPENLKSKKLATFFQTFDPASYSKKKNQLPISSSSRNSLLTSLPPNTPSNGKDYTGVIEYLTAQNIRNKVRNPIFLAIRFPDCFTIHYNPVAPKLEGKTEEGVLLEFQSALKECFAYFKKKKDGEMSTEPSPNSSMSNFFGSSDVLPMNTPLQVPQTTPQADCIFKLQVNLPMGIDENHLNRKLVDLVVRITVSGHIGVVYSLEGVPSGWKALPGDDELLDVYTKSYDSMLMLKMSDDREKTGKVEDEEILIKKRSTEDLRNDEDSNLRVMGTFQGGPSMLGGEPLGAFLAEKKKKTNQIQSAASFPNLRAAMGGGSEAAFHEMNQQRQQMFPGSNGGLAQGIFQGNLNMGHQQQQPLNIGANKLIPNPQLSLLAFNNIKSGQKLISSIDNVNGTFKKAFTLSQQLLDSEMSLANDARRSLVNQLHMLAQQQLVECTQATYTLIQSTNLMHSIIVAGDINNHSKSSPNFEALPGGLPNSK